MLLLVLVALPWLKASAQDAAAGGGPAVVVSVANVDRLLADIGYLTRAAGMPQVGGLVTIMAGPYLDGLDSKRPAGFFLTLDGALPSGVVFVPVTNFGSVLKKIEEQVGKPAELGDGLRKVSLQRDFFIKQQGTWVFLADQAANLASVPEDPSRYLGGLDRQYSVAVRLNASSLPPQLKEMALARATAERRPRVAGCRGGAGLRRIASSWRNCPRRASGCSPRSCTTRNK